MLALSQGLTKDAFVNSKDIHERNNLLFITAFFSRERRTNYQSIAEFACIACCSWLVTKPDVSFHISSYYKDKEADNKFLRKLNHV